MSLSPARLLEHAERLVAPPLGASPPTEEDLRRAISAAYYAVFHTAVGAIADLFFWATDRTHPIYERIYRSAAHKDIVDRCKRYRSLCEKTGDIVDPDINEFAIAFQTLYGKRLDADYKPAIAFAPIDAERFVVAARNAVEHFNNADAGARRLFLSLIVFPPKSDV